MSKDIPNNIKPQIELINETAHGPEFNESTQSIVDNAQAITQVNKANHNRKLAQDELASKLKQRDDNRVRPVDDGLEQSSSLLDVNDRPSSVAQGRAPTGSGKSYTISEFLNSSTASKPAVTILHTRVQVTEAYKSDILNKRESGYIIGGIDNSQDKNKNIFQTPQILINQLLNDPMLDKYSEIVIDEADEMSLSMMAIIRELMKQRPDLLITFISATLDTDKFAKIFNIKQEQTAIIDDSIRVRPIETQYSNEYNTLSVRSAVGRMVGTFKEMESEQKIIPGNTGLALVPTYRAASNLAFELEDLYKTRIDIRVITGQNSVKENDHLLTKPPSKDKITIFICTPIITRGVTFPESLDPSFVLNAGLINRVSYDKMSGRDTIGIDFATTAEIEQTQGRAGRNPKNTESVYSRVMQPKSSIKPADSVNVDPTKDILEVAKYYSSLQPRKVIKNKKFLINNKTLITKQVSGIENVVPSEYLPSSLNSMLKDLGVDEYFITSSVERLRSFNAIDVKSQVTDFGEFLLHSGVSIDYGMMLYDSLINANLNITSQLCDTISLIEMSRNLVEIEDFKATTNGLKSPKFHSFKSDKKDSFNSDFEFYSFIMSSIKNQLQAENAGLKWDLIQLAKTNSADLKDRLHEFKSKNKVISNSIEHFDETISADDSIKFSSTRYTKPIIKNKSRPIIKTNDIVAVKTSETPATEISPELTLRGTLINSAANYLLHTLCKKSGDGYIHLASGEKVEISSNSIAKGTNAEFITFGTTTKSKDCYYADTVMPLNIDDIIGVKNPIFDITSNIYGTNHNVYRGTFEQITEYFITNQLGNLNEVMFYSSSEIKKDREAGYKVMGKYLSKELIHPSEFINRLLTYYTVKQIESDESRNLNDYFSGLCKKYDITTVDEFNNMLIHDRLEFDVDETKLEQLGIDKGDFDVHVPLEFGGNDVRYITRTTNYIGFPKGQEAIPVLNVKYKGLIELVKSGEIKKMPPNFAINIHGENRINNDWMYHFDDIELKKMIEVELTKAKPNVVIDGYGYGKPLELKDCSEALKLYTKYMSVNPINGESVYKDGYSYAKSPLDPNHTVRVFPRINVMNRFNNPKFYIEWGDFPDPSGNCEKLDRYESEKNKFADLLVLVDRYKDSNEDYEFSPGYSNNYALIRNWEYMITDITSDTPRHTMESPQFISLAKDIERVYQSWILRKKDRNFKNFQDSVRTKFSEEYTKDRFTQEQLAQIPIILAAYTYLPETGDPIIIGSFQIDNSIVKNKDPNQLTKPTMVLNPKFILPDDFDADNIDEELVAVPKAIELSESEKVLKGIFTRIDLNNNFTKIIDLGTIDIHTIPNGNIKTGANDQELSESNDKQLPPNPTLRNWFGKSTNSPYFAPTPMQIKEILDYYGPKESITIVKDPKSNNKYYILPFNSELLEDKKVNTRDYNYYYETLDSNITQELEADMDENITMEFEGNTFIFSMLPLDIVEVKKRNK